MIEFTCTGCVGDEEAESGCHESFQADVEDEDLAGAIAGSEGWLQTEHGWWCPNAGATIDRGSESDGGGLLAVARAVGAQEKNAPPGAGRPAVSGSSPGRGTEEEP